MAENPGPAPPPQPEPQQPSPELRKFDLLDHLSAAFLDSFADTQARISGGEEATRSFHLGLSRLQLYEFQSVLSELFSAAAQEVADTLKVIVNRQDRLVEGVGLLGVATSLTTGGCVFCGEQSLTGENLRGDELFAHIEKHFSFDSGAYELKEWTDEQLMAMGFPPDKGPEARREEMQIAHKFLMVDMRTECHHCKKEFELEDGLLNPSGLVSGDAMTNTHRIYCPVLRKKGMVDYPNELNELLFPSNVMYAELAPGMDMRLRMYRSFLAKNKMEANGNETSSVELENLRRSSNKGDGPGSWGSPGGGGGPSGGGGEGVEGGSNNGGASHLDQQHEIVGVDLLPGEPGSDQQHEIVDVTQENARRREETEETDSVWQSEPTPENAQRREVIEEIDPYRLSETPENAQRREVIEEIDPYRLSETPENAQRREVIEEIDPHQFSSTQSLTQSETTPENAQRREVIEEIDPHQFSSTQSVTQSETTPENAQRREVIEEIDPHQFSSTQSVTQSETTQENAQKREAIEKTDQGVADLTKGPGPGVGGSTVDDPVYIDYGADDLPPYIEDESPAVPPKHEGKTDPNDDDKPPPLALDTPMEVIDALTAHGKDVIRASDWSDNLLLDFLAGKEAKRFGKLPPGTTRNTILAWSKEEACASKDWIWWLFPIPDLPWPEGEDTRDLPRMSLHFLMRYDSDHTDRLRAHSYQNLEWFWRLIGFMPYHPPDPEARTVLNLPSDEFYWSNDAKSVIPEAVSQCLRHLRMIGFQYEARLTFWALCSLLNGEDGDGGDGVGEHLLKYLAEWERITYWPLDIYWVKVIQNFAALRGGDMEPGVQDAMLAANPMVPKRNFEQGNEHTYVQNAIDIIGRETIYTLRRQPARDQYVFGMLNFESWRDTWKDGSTLLQPKDSSPRKRKR